MKIYFDVRVTRPDDEPARGWLEVPAQALCNEGIVFDEPARGWLEVPAQASCNEGIIFMVPRWLAEAAAFELDHEHDEDPVEAEIKNAIRRLEAEYGSQS